ncbi:MAG: hypothetical protein IJF27_04675 [Oscillospiraceae bacterium]|nr:hypothetical protein [Oscillospiraceae bacterium]
MKKLYPILTIAAAVLSIISVVISAITLSAVLKLDSDIEQSSLPQSSTDDKQQSSHTEESSEEEDQESSSLTEDIVFDIKKPNIDNSGWHFEFPIKNYSDTQLTLNSILVLDHVGGPKTPYRQKNVIGSERFVEINIANQGDACVLAPGEDHFWNDWHPLVDRFDSRTYVFVFDTDNGRQISYSYPFDMRTEADDFSYAADDGQDLKTLRHSADFENEVSHGVYWVPANALGKSNLTNAEIHGMLTASPDEKKDGISNLYEAIQLYQIGLFSYSDDNITTVEKGLTWDHRKPGFDSVRTNSGGDSSSANWLSYMLADDYDEVGFFALYNPDGRGHTFNYILEDGWYYFIDMTYYCSNDIRSAVESGITDDYRSTDYILGNIHKTNDPQRYASYILERFNTPPAMLVMYTAENSLSTAFISDTVTVVYEDKNTELLTLHDNDSDDLTLELRPSPSSAPDWSLFPDFDFSYL